MYMYIGLTSLKAAVTREAALFLHAQRSLQLTRIMKFNPYFSLAICEPQQPY
jgi:hypothetical protein